ncbi:MULTISPECIES: methyl-accepting chemotaxis protein [Vibrio]|uniref:methyl-accepting chemotaxis protein n=1 Tax=Vibrio TaxID=662 RepID=UPI0020761FC8|nr:MULTISPECIES: methyl-accepting chemotaxis protein [Vibrio]USD34997.1 methyl-accepting chemotaxis protein [Vibrio sp. SCSIO 43186]USD48063.1 methyl-accepting chemotaxis protein [Vibrio sp. SCSIO 43145]USD72122.1 methyl-accepting chemotaxis protein [Vibrio sp. SCSIO 43139]USD97794.1 chemotaxis protein [Vibrio coralliilyticus]
MLSKLTIAQKVYLLGFSQLLAMMIMGGFALYQMNKIGNELVDIAEEDIPLTKMLTVVTEHQLEQAILFERALIKAIRVEQGMAQMSVFEEAKKKVHDLTVKTEKELYEVEQFIEKAIPLLHSVEAQEKFEKLLGKLKVVEKSYSTLVGEVDKTMDYGSNGQIEEMLEFSKKVEAHEDEIDKSLISILDEVHNFTLASALQAEEDEKYAIKWMTIIASVSIALGVLLPFLVTCAIRTPILNLIDRLKQVAEGDGDLTIRLDDSSRDETGTVANAFNHFLGVLIGTISQINGQARELGGSSQVAVTAMQRTLQNVEKQRCDIEQVATAINQMNATTQEVANSTANASSVTDEVRKRVMDGQKEALATQEVIQELANEVTTSSGVIENLVSETNNIGQVLESIQGIAEQTNLLALNAAIEAARAGETGRGFAVVADEVRSLAQRTQEATVDIQQLVDTLQSEARNAVSSMKKGTDTAKLCLEKSSESANTFSIAAESVNQIAGLNLQIAAAAEEQSTVTQDLDNNLTSIKTLAEETAEETKSTAMANEAIAKHVNDLHTNLSKFKV